jgi:hypothetical protein
MRCLIYTLIVLVLLLSRPHAQHYNITQPFETTKVIAGIGNPSFSGDGGQAIEAGLNNPRDIAIDSNGNLYIADTGNHRIRKVNALSGVITNIVGNGEKGFSEDGIAVDMKLDTPEYLTIDNNDNVIFVDKGNFSIRKLEQNTGTVITLFKELNVDLGQVLADKDGNIYFTKISSHSVVVGKYLKDGGVIYRLTNSGNGVRVYPEKDEAYIRGISLDPFGNILISGENVKFSPIVGQVIENLKIPSSVYAGSALLSVVSSAAMNPSGQLYFASSIIAYDEEIVSSYHSFSGFNSERLLTVYLQVDVELGGGFTEPGYTRITDWTNINYGQIGTTDFGSPLYGEISIPKIITDHNNNILMVFLKDGIHQIKRVTVGKAYQPSINISPSAIDFGDVELGKSKSIELTVSNDGNMKLLIPQISSKNSFVQTDIGLLTLDEGGNKKIEITFQAQDKTPLNASLTFVSNDPDSLVVEIPLKATPIFGQIKLKQSEIDFGNILVNSETTKNLVVENEGQGTLVLNSASFQGDGFSANIDSVVVESGKVVEIPIIFKPNGEEKNTSTLTVNTNDPDKSVVSITLNGEGSIPVVTVDLDIDDIDSQKKLLKGLRAGDEVSLQIFGNEMPALNGFSAVFNFDKIHVKVADNQKFQVGSFLSGALPIVTSTDTSLVANIASTGGVSTAKDALLGTAQFILLEGFADSTTISLQSMTFSALGGLTTVDLGLVVVLSAESDLVGDFDGNGEVGFTDFLQFAQNFGKKSGEDGFDGAFDFDKNNEVGFTDFLTFAQQFGKKSDG